MVTWQLTIDCSSPSRLVDFWAGPLGYVPRPPPDGYETWNAWYRAFGVPDDELDLTGDGTDRLIDPTGGGPEIWFQGVPERKQIKNRFHLDVLVGGGRSLPIEERRRRVDATVADLVERGGTIQRVSDQEDGYDHYFVVMHDPEGNEFCVV